MAGLEYNELQGNESLLKAAEFLRMLPEWKAKPGKLRTGFVEYAELIARHLVNRYCELEGKPLTEKLDLDASTNPLIQEREASAQLDRQSADFKSYIDRLNSWHLQLAGVRDVVSHVFDELDRDAPEWMHATALLAQDRFSHLVESCPFPTYHENKS
jgi:hypothetical protein